jgi:hypothetical protein
MTPANLTQALRTERLAGQGAVLVNGVSVQVTGGRRSTSETLVTVEITPASVEPLGEPRLVVNREATTGVQSDSEEGGRLLTYSFPPTPFGASPRIEFEAFRAASGKGSSVASFDLGAMMARAGISGADLESVAVMPGDLHSPAGETPPPITKVTFYYLPNAQVGPIMMIRIELGANYDDRKTAWALVTATGRLARLGSTNDLYNKDMTGTIRGGTHQLDFEVTKADVNGMLTLQVGEPLSIIRGLWSVPFAVDLSRP